MATTSKLIATMITALLGAAVANQVWYERKRRKETHVLKEEIGKWEGEGGNVPEVPDTGPADRRNYA